MTTQFAKLLSFILASVNDPPPSIQQAYRPQIACHSCMSGYLENQFVFITSLYKKPLAFTEKCDENNFDSQYLRTKNCTDACVTLMMNDKVGGRRRIGFMRGCLSDILHYNRTAVRIYDHSSSSSVMGGGTNGRSGSSSHCSRIRLRDLFISSDRYAFDTHDFVKLCACLRPLCNSAAKTLSGQTTTMMTLFATFLIWFLTHSWQYGYALHLSGSDMIYHTNDQKLNFERWNPLIRYQCEYKMSSKCTIPNNESNPSHTKHRLKTKCSISEKYISH
ncbi:ly-6-related protein [Ditylenchus destructor]|nr:ly-6-related protein [Ditylenchus destructor]